MTVVVVDASDQVRQLEACLGVLSETMNAFAAATTDYDQLLTEVAPRAASIIRNTCTVQLVSDDRVTLTPIALHATDPAALARTARSSPPIRSSSPATASTAA